jgi:excisionase family DNA binding protein
MIILLYQPITFSTAMEDLLTTREVLDILKVDRITIYRMLQDGRLKGVKIGQQWRFPRREVEHLLGNAPSQAEEPVAESNNSFPTHCVQTIQDLFAEVGQISALVVDADGEPLTEISHPCRLCQVMQGTPSGQAACRASWKEFARQSGGGARHFTCHAGINYMSAPIVNQEKAVGYLLAGEFYWQAPESQEQNERLQRLADAHRLPANTLRQASSSIPVISLEQYSRVETWPTTAARAVQSILNERFNFMNRLQQIASLTQIH